MSTRGSRPTRTEFPHRRTAASRRSEKGSKVRFLGGYPVRSEPWGLSPRLSIPGAFTFLAYGGEKPRPLVFRGKPLPSSGQSAILTWSCPSGPPECNLVAGRGAVWLARLNGVQKVASSNLVAPTRKARRSKELRRAFFFRYCRQHRSALRLRYGRKIFRPAKNRAERRSGPVVSRAAVVRIGP